MTVGDELKLLMLIKSQASAGAGARGDGHAIGGVGRAAHGVVPAANEPHLARSAVCSQRIP